MITDEQIEALDACQYDWSCHDKEEKYAFARRVIALAQEVRPLNWRQDGSYWRATCDYGFYELRPVGFFFRVYLNESGSHNILAREVAGLDEAMQIAQSDFAARVLANLKYGGTND